MGAASYLGEPPATHRVDVDHAMRTLDYIEMVALSEMFERWALTEEGIDGDQRTKLLQQAADYERIAIYLGQDWVASSPSSPAGMIPLIAAHEVRLRTGPRDR